MVLFGVGTSTLIILFLFLVWLRLNRCLSLLGSALAGALFASSVIDGLWAFGSGDRLIAILVPFLLALGALALVRWDVLLPTRRWVAFGLVGMFIVRALGLASVHADWSGRLSGNVRTWLVMAGLDPSALPAPKAFPPRILSDMDMPCGLDSFRVRSDDLRSVSGSLKVRIAPCGLSPQSFRIQGSETVEISNALGMAVEITFARQSDDGEFFPASSVVVPPESSIEVSDLKMPVGGLILMYAPLEPQLGIVLGANGQPESEYWVSRQPLTVKRQSVDSP